MRHILFFISIFLIFHITIKASDNKRLLCEKTWKINEFYVEKMKVLNGKLDSTKYEFKTDMTFLLKNEAVGAVSLRWETNENVTKFKLIAGDNVLYEADITFLDNDNLIFTYFTTNRVNNQTVKVECRMIPDIP